MECTICKKQYVGETTQTINSRFRLHESFIKNKRDNNIAEHFNLENHTNTSYTIIVVGADEKIHQSPTDEETPLDSPKISFPDEDLVDIITDESWTILDTVGETPAPEMYFLPHMKISQTFYIKNKSCMKKLQKKPKKDYLSRKTLSDH